MQTVDLTGRNSLRTIHGWEQQKAMWEDKSESVTLYIPTDELDVRTLRVRTDGSSLKIRWKGGSMVFPLYSAIVESETGPARVKDGMFSLPLRKAVAEPWPEFTALPDLDDPFESVGDGPNCPTPAVCGIACVAPCYR